MNHENNGEEEAYAINPNAIHISDSDLSVFASAMDSWSAPEYLKVFQEYHSKMLDIVKRKNHDYSGETEPFRNFMLVESLGVATTEEGFVVRMSDKLMRVANLVSSGNPNLVEDEKIEDTLIDLANYALLLATYRKMKR